MMREIEGRVSFFIVKSTIWVVERWRRKLIEFRRMPRDACVGFDQRDIWREFIEKLLAFGFVRHSIATFSIFELGR